MIAVKNISVSFEDKTVINDISFDIKEAEYVSLIGPNGAGKSTILKALCRIVPLSSGSVSLYGKDISGVKQKELAKSITYIGQLPAGEFTVEDFVLMSRYPYLSPFSGISERDVEVCRQSLKITYTEKFAKRKLCDLSSGERQRVAIASALAQETGIILFDEPVTHLDPYFDHEISELICNIHKESKITVLNATHNLNNAIRYSDRILALSNGEAVFFKKPGDIPSSDMSSLFGVGFISLENPSDKKTIMIRV